jgi:hypothetical protein
VEETGKYLSRNSLKLQRFWMPSKNLSSTLALVVRRDEEKRAKERIFWFVTILVSGMKKTNVQNYLIY